MRLCARLLLILCAAVAQGCINSTVLLHVKPDGSGRAVVTSHVYFAGVAAFDSLFSDQRPNGPPSLTELLPEPTPGAAEHAMGTPVRLVSSTLEKATDGGTRTTIVDFDDVTRVRLTFPPEFALLSGSALFGLAIGEQTPVITFARRRHTNGDELLVLKMPDPAVVQADPNDLPITKFATDSPEERSLRRALQNMGLQLTVELEQPLLRTNAPKMSDNGATILDLNMDRIVNAMDETTARRMISANSFQEVLWRLGDLPGASVPVDREVFLEYEQAQRAATPAPQPQAPPDTEIYLLPLKIANRTITLGSPANVTNNPGYDNQPFFTADSRSILFTSIRPSTVLGPGGAPQTDIYRYDLSTAQTTQITNTPESEYSPTITPTGMLAVVRVESDEQKTQRLWQFTADGRDPRVVLENVKPVGYHAWADDHSVALFILGAGGGAPATLQLADTRSGVAKTLATDIGRSIQPIPGSGLPHAVSFVQRERTNGKTALVIKELNPVTQAISVLTPAVEGSTEADTAWTPDGTLLMAHDGILYSWRRGQSGWTEAASLERMGLTGVTRLAVSPRGNWLALVAAPQTSR
jgi:hypothetical protein